MRLPQVVVVVSPAAVMECIAMAGLDYNAAATLQLHRDTAYSAFLAWAHEGGIVHPSLEVPAIFGEQLLGIRALHPIPSLKAIMFVPYRLCLGLQAAERILGSFFSSEPDLFLTHKHKNDYRLYALLLHEKLQGESSFYWPYLRILRDAEILIDWSDEEIAELQDPAIPTRVETYRRVMEKYWKQLEPVVLRHSDLFPHTEDLYSLFKWVYKIVQTRSFAWGDPEGMLIPVADFFNHTDIYANYETCTAQYMAENASASSTFIDYSDFNGAAGAIRQDAGFHNRSYKSKLRKYMDKAATWERLQALESIWKADELIKEDNSSSDEDFRVVIESEEEEEKDTTKPLPQTEADYFVLSTGSKGSFQAGDQVCICYGRKSNLDLLLFYGFVPEFNYRDSVLVPVHGTDFKLKWNRLNQDIIAYYRLELVEALITQGVFKPAMRDALGIRPILGGIESAAIGKALHCYKLYEQARFRTNEAEDRAILAAEPGFRLRTAVYYRISQRRILQKQIELLETLSSVLSQIKASTWESSLSRKSPEEIEGIYPLRNYLRAYDNNRVTWAQNFSSS